MKNALFFQTKQIPDPEIIFDQFKQRAIFFSYFQVDQKYYLFFYSQKPMEIDFLYQAVDVIQELDSKKRKLRSLRGFLLYALEIIDNGKDYEILSTNLQPFFWRKVENILRQNKKGALQEFLFGSQLNHSDEQKDFQERIQINQNQNILLLQRVIDLEIKVEEYARRRQNKASEAIKSIPQEDSQAKAQKEDNFMTLEKICEEDKVEIIKLGFLTSQEGKLSLKKYYEGKGEDTLFEWKGYQIKYDSIRKTKMYQQLKYSPIDWNERIDYQKKQEEFYKLAIKRKKEIKRLKVLDKKSYYTKEELDAMDYFHGTGFYQKQQDPKVKPNIFDTRQSFL